MMVYYLKQKPTVLQRELPALRKNHPALKKQEISSFFLFGT
jgi:hypothetical protein